MTPLRDMLLITKDGRLFFVHEATGTMLPHWGGSGSGGGGSPPPPPPPTEAETRLQNAQADAATEQLAITKAQVGRERALEPFLLAGTGIKQTGTDAAGNPIYTQDPAYAQFQQDQLAFQKQQMAAGAAALATQNKLNPLLLKQAGITVDPVTGEYSIVEDPAAAQQREISTLANARTLAALKGELPVTATLQRQLTVGRQNLNEELVKRLGPGYETSTAGIQAIAAYEAEATALKEAEQKDQLTTAQALALSSGEELRRKQSQALSATASGASGPESSYNTVSSIVDSMNNRNTDIYGRLTGIGDQSRASAAALGQATTSLGTAAAPLERYRSQVYGSQVGAYALGQQRRIANQQAIYGGGAALGSAAIIGIAI